MLLSQLTHFYLLISKLPLEVGTSTCNGILISITFLFFGVGFVKLFHE